MMFVFCLVSRAVQLSPPDYSGFTSDPIVIDTNYLNYNLKECIMTNVRNSQQNACAIYFDTAFDKGLKYHLNIYSSIITQCKVYQGAAIFNNGCSLVFNVNFMCVSDCTAEKSGALIFSSSNVQDEDHTFKYLSSSSCTSSFNVMDFVASKISTQKIEFVYSNMSKCVATQSNDYPNVFMFKNYEKHFTYNTFSANQGSSYLLFFQNDISSQDHIDYCNFISNTPINGIIVADSGCTLYINYCVVQGIGNGQYVCDANSGGSIYFNNCIVDNDEKLYYYFDRNHFNSQNVTLLMNDAHYYFSYYSTHNCIAEIPYPRMTATPFETPYNTPFETPFETPVSTPYDTPEYTPFETPFKTPIETLFNTPFDTPEHTPFDTPESTLIETPIETAERTLFETPYKTPFQTLSHTQDQTTEYTTFITPKQTIPQTDNPTPYQSDFSTEEDTNIKSSEESDIHTQQTSSYEQSEPHIERSSAEIQSSFEESSSILMDGPNNAGGETIHNNKSNGSGSIIYIIIGVIAAILIIIAVIIIILIRRKRKDTLDQSESSDIEMYEETFSITKDKMPETITLFTTNSILDESDPFNQDFLEGSDDDLYIPS